MHGRRTLRSSQSRHSVHEWLDRVGHALWHRHLRNVLRLFGPAVHGKDEGTVAPSGFFALAQQRIEQLFRILPFTRNTQRNSVATQDFRIKSEEHTSEPQSIRRVSYDVSCSKN